MAMRALAITLTLSIMYSISPAAKEGGGDRIAGAPFATRSPVIAQHGIAATSHPLASQIAIDILKKGGSAVDAAIAANAAIGLMEPTGNGIGGDLFAIVWDPQSRQLHGLNGSGRSPRALTLTRLRDELGEQEQIPFWGSLPVSVPGTVDGWFELHARFGKLAMADLLAPAISYARGGFPVTQVVGNYLEMNLGRFNEARDLIEEFDNATQTYFRGGRAPREGEIFRNPDLALTLEKIARGGRDAFYSGEIADVIDAYMRRIGGYLRKEDLAAHKSEWVDPVSVNYRGYDVYELPPNGQGIAALQMLNILEAYDLRAMGHNSADYLHVMTEAKKLAFDDRARFYADPDFFDVPLDTLLSKDYAAARRKLIRMDGVLLEVRPSDMKLARGDTIYMTVADSDGMMVSLIQSNYVGMGSGLVADGLGFMFQDRGALFALDEGHANVFVPGKRPFHTIIPAFAMKDGEPFLSFGVMGGSMQPQGHVQVFVNIVDFGMNVQEAGDAARYNHSGSSQPTGTVMIDGGKLSVESGIAAGVIEDLRARGHVVEVEAGIFGGYQAILWDPVNRAYHGASEMRKDGGVAGY